MLREHPGRLVVPTLVVSEAAYLIASRVGTSAEARFLGDLAAGDFHVEPVHPADRERVAELVVRHRDLRLGTTDASVVAAAERLGVTTVATLDRRHFGAVRPRHVDVFTLVPGD